MIYKCTSELTGFQPIFAFLSNAESLSLTTTSNIVNIDPISFDHDQFLYLFYNTLSRNFNLNKSNADYCTLLFNNLKIDGNSITLLDMFYSIWETNNNKNRNIINPGTSIAIARYLAGYKSITNVTPTLVSLSYNDLIQSLLDNLVVVESNEEFASASVTFLLNVQINVSLLDISVTLNIPVDVVIPGYTNLFQNKDNLNNDKINKALVNKANGPTELPNAEYQAEADFGLDQVINNYSADVDDNLPDGYENYTPADNLGLNKLKISNILHLDNDEIDSASGSGDVDW
jgi:hypothetical protein